MGRVTADGGRDYVEPSARIAVFDNDGTLWCEKPMYIQLDFIVRRLAEKAADRPDTGHPTSVPGRPGQRPHWFGAAITKHYQGDDADLKVLAGRYSSLHESMTVEEFTRP